MPTQILSDDEARQAATILQRDDIPDDVREKLTTSLRQKFAAEGAPKAPEQIEAEQAIVKQQEADAAFAPMLEGSKEVLRYMGEGFEGLGRNGASILVGAANGALTVGPKAAQAVMMGTEWLMESQNLDASAVRAGREYLKRGTDEIDNLAETARQALEAASGTTAVGRLGGEMVATWPMQYFKVGKGGLAMMKNIAANGSLGVGLGAITAVPDAETASDLLGSMTFGGLFGAGFSAVFGFAPGVRHFVARKYEQSLEKGLAKDALALEKKVQQMTGNPDFHFTIGQIAGDSPWAVGLEVGAMGREAFKRQKEQLTILSNFLEKNPTMPPEQLLSGIGNLVGQTAKNMRNTATRNYAAGLKAVSELGDDTLVLDGKRYLQALRDATNDLTNPLKMGSEGVPSNWSRHMTEVDNMVEPYGQRATADGMFEIIKKSDGSSWGLVSSADEARATVQGMNAEVGGLTVDEVQQILRGHNDLLAGQSGFFEAASGGSLDSIVKMVNRELHMSLGASSEPAIKLLQKVQGQYQYDMTAIETLRNGVLPRILGVADEKFVQLVDSPDAMLDRIMAIDNPRTFRQVKKVMEDVAPGMMQDLKDTLLRRMVRTTKTGNRSVAEPEVSLDAMADALTGSGSWTGLTRGGEKIESTVTGRRFQGLFSPAEQQELIDTGNALRRLKVTYLKPGAKDTAGVAADVAINIVSRSAEFMTRMLVRLGSKGQSLERLMTDPRARGALREIAQEGIGTQSGAMAAAYLTLRMGYDAYEERVENEKKARDIASQRQ